MSNFLEMWKKSVITIQIYKAYVLINFGIVTLVSITNPYYFSYLENKKSPHFRELFIEMLVFSVAAGEGFEPPTFGL